MQRIRTLFSMSGCRTHSTVNFCRHIKRDDPFRLFNIHCMDTKKPLTVLSRIAANNIDIGNKILRRVVYHSVIYKNGTTYSGIEVRKGQYSKGITTHHRPCKLAPSSDERPLETACQCKLPDVEPEKAVYNSSERLCSIADTRQ